jgi:glycosyltransferase involved in cell wall biosynthesis
LNEFPRISVITPSLNSESFIGEALESLAVQDYPGLESIVVDGGSIDDTVSIARSYPFCKVIVRPGMGLYAALNEGIGACTGQFISFLNSDDMLGPGILKEVAGIYESMKDVDIIGGRAILFEDNKDGRRHIVDDYSRYTGKTFDAHTLMFGAPLINAHFFNTNVFRKTGLFDNTYKLAADRDFMIRCYKNEPKIIYTQSLVYKYRRHHGSLTLNRKKSNTYAMGVEHIRIADALSNSDNDVLRRLAARSRDDAAVTALAACLRSGQIFGFFSFFLRHSLRDPLFMLRLPLAVGGKVRRRIRYLRQ